MATLTHLFPLCSPAATGLLASSQLEEARKGMEEAYTAVAARHKELTKLADDRASFRQDIAHYEEKLPGLQVKATANPKEQVRLEENQKKLEEVSLLRCWGAGGGGRLTRQACSMAPSLASCVCRCKICCGSSLLRPRRCAGD